MLTEFHVLYCIRIPLTNHLTLNFYFTPTGEGAVCHDDPSVACLSEGPPTTVALHLTRLGHLPACVNLATTLPIPRLCKLAGFTTRTRH